MLQGIEGVLTVVAGAGNTWTLTSHEHVDIRPAVFKMAVEQKLTVLTISRDQQGLEQIFRELTQSGS